MCGCENHWNRYCPEDAALWWHRAPKHRADVPVDSCRHLRLTWQSMCHYCTDCGLCAPTHRAEESA